MSDSSPERVSIQHRFRHLLEPSGALARAEEALKLKDHAVVLLRHLPDMAESASPLALIRRFRNFVKMFNDWQCGGKPRMRDSRVDDVLDLVDVWLARPDNFRDFEFRLAVSVEDAVSSGDRVTAGLGGMLLWHLREDQDAYRYHALVCISEIRLSLAAFERGQMRSKRCG